MCNINRRYKIIIILIGVIVLMVLSFRGYTLKESQIENDIEEWLSTPYPDINTQTTIVDRYKEGRVVAYAGIFNNMQKDSYFTLGYKRHFMLPLYKREAGQLQDIISNKVDETNFFSIRLLFRDYHFQSDYNNKQLYVTEEIDIGNLVKGIIGVLLYWAIRLIVVFMKK